MPHHTFAYTGSVNSAAFTDTPALTDQIFQIQNGHFILPKDMRLLYAAYLAVSAIRARIVTPKLRQITTTPLIRSVNRAAVAATGFRLYNYLSNPIVLKGLEETEVDTLNDAGGAEQQCVILSVYDQLIPMPAGDPILYRGTGTTTVTANVWTDVPVTWNDLLPNGNYAIVGLNVFGATCKAARLIVPNQDYRPGCLGLVNEYGQGDESFLGGGFGVWGTFLNTNMPRLQVLCGAADTAQIVHLEIIKIG
jgi:hypothetical protein